MRSTARIALRVLGALFAALAIIFALGAWRLSSGPLSLGFLSPYIEEAFEGEDLSYRIEFDDTVLVWAGWDRALEVRLTGVRVAAADGGTLARVPEASLGVSGAALLGGVVAPTSIELLGLRLGLLRDAEGRVTLAGGGDDAGTDDGAAEALVADLLDPPHEDHPLARLQRVGLRDAAFALHDETSGLTWTAANAGLTLDMDDAAIFGHLSTDLQVRDIETRLEVKLFHHRESEMGSAALAFSALDPSRLASIAPELAEFSGIRVPLSGTLAFDLAPGGAFDGAEFDIAGGAGEVSLPALFPAPVPVRRLAAAGSVDGTLSRVTLESFTLDTDRPRFSFGGEIRQTSAGIGLHGRFQAHDMPFDALVDYWPEAFLETGRGWITHNIRDGVITRFDAALDIEPGTLEEGRITAASATGTLAFENASVHYLRPMPAVEGVGGSGRFTGESLTLTMNDGRIDGIAASRGTASLSDFHAESPHLSVTVEAEGPAADALALLDHPRLALMSKVGLRPRNVGGTVHTLFTLDLPADTTITAEQIELTAVARVSGARMEEIAGTVDMSEGALRLGIDEASMDLRGTARLQGIPATVSWQENFGGDAPFARALEVSMTVTPEDRAVLGLDLAPYMQGSVALDARYSDPGGARPHATLLFDLTKARLGSPDLPWSKPAGEPGTLRVLAAVPPEGAIRLTRIEVDAGSLNAVGQATLARGLDHFSGDAPFVQGLDVSMTVTPQGGAPQGGTVLGLDLTPYVQGSVVLDTHFTGPDGGEPPRVALSFDLTEARLDIPDLGWSKPAGEPGTLSVLAAFAPEDAIQLTRFEIDAGTLNAVGQATLARGLEHFNGDAPFVQGLDASVTVTPQGGAPQGGTALGLDLAPYVQGSVTLDARFSDPGGGEPPRVALSFDVTEARLEIPNLDWSKPAGEPGTVSALAAFLPEGAIRLTRFEVEAGSLNAVGQATLARGFDHFSGDVSFVQGLDAAVTVTPQGGAPQGGRALGLDLAPYMQGSVALDARFSDPGGGAPPGATLLFDLTEARLEIPDLGWSKPAGEPGTVSVLAAFLPEGAIQLTRFEVEAGSLNAVGQATLARGFDHFGGAAPFVQGLDAAVTVTPQGGVPRGGRALGLDLAPYMQGSVALDARFSDPGGGAPPRVALSFDVTEARLEIPDLGWSKPAGEPGTVSVLAAFAPEGAIQFTRFEIDAGSLNAVGQATLARGLDHFGGDVSFLQGLDASVTVTPQGGAPRGGRALGLDLAPYVQGGFALDARISDPGGGAPPGAMLLFDMTEARLEIPALYWFKPAGEPGTVSVRAAFPPEGAVRLTGVELKTGTLYAAGRATLASGPGAVRDITIERLQHGATDITGTIETGGGATLVSVRGASLDARPYLTGLMEEGAPQSGPLVLDLDVERVVTAGNQQLTGVRARFETDSEGRHAGFMKGTLSSGAPLHFSLEPQAGKRLVTVRSRDAGAVARAFDIYDNAIGGDLLMEAVLHDDRPGRPVTGTVRIDRYQVADAPTLARLLTIATLTGIVDVLQGEGIAFSEFVLPFSIEDDVVTVRNARTSGFSLGITAGGTVDLETDRVNISGTVVPAYSLNSLVGNIPLLGELLTGGEGGGLFAATYRVGRTTEEPSVTVNPLSILAPGFLRGLFLFLEEDESAASE